MSAPIPAATVPDATARLARFGPPLLGMIVIEFLLGMAVNLFVALPTGGASAILAASAVLDAHIVLAVLLLGITTNALRAGLRANDRTAVGVTVLGALGAWGATLAGLDFVFGDQSPAASFAMAVGFAALTIEAGYLLRLRIPSRGPAGPGETPTGGARAAAPPGAP